MKKRTFKKQFNGKGSKLFSVTTNIPKLGSEFYFLECPGQDVFDLAARINVNINNPKGLESFLRKAFRALWEKHN